MDAYMHMVSICEEIKQCTHCGPTIIPGHTAVTLAFFIEVKLKVDENEYSEKKPTRFYIVVDKNEKTVGVAKWTVCNYLFRFDAIF